MKKLLCILALTACSSKQDKIQSAYDDLPNAMAASLEVVGNRIVIHVSGGAPECRDVKANIYYLLGDAFLEEHGIKVVECAK